jgi:membrane protein implicated in regulation of membrane protease activity
MNVNNDKMKGSLFLILIAVVELVLVLGLVIFHVERLPDPLGVITLLVVAFGPMTIMFYYFITRFLHKERYENQKMSMNETSMNITTENTK